MSRKFQAYFKSENDALDVQTRLQAQGARNIEVSELQDGYTGGRGRLLIPIAAAGAVSNGMGGAGGVSGAGYGTTPAAAPGIAAAAAASNDLVNHRNVGEANGADGRSDDNDLAYADDADHRDLTHVLSANVPDEAYVSAANVVRSYNGYLEVLD